FATSVSIRESLVASELLLRSFKQLARHDRWHVDRDPLVGRLVARCTLRATRCRRAAANRAKRLATFNTLRLAERSLSHVRGVLKNRPHGGVIPAWCTSTCRDLSGIEVSHDRADRFLFVHERVEDAAHHLRFMQKDAEARRCLVRLLHVREAIWRSTHRIYRA